MENFYDVFMSHHSVDKPFVEEIANLLKQKGLNPFLDKWDLLPGQPWIDEIEHYLKSSNSCAIFIGENGLGPVQKTEMRVALIRKIRIEKFPIIPVLLPNIKEPIIKSLPIYIAQHTWVDFRNGVNDEVALQKLILGIKFPQLDDQKQYVCSKRNTSIVNIPDLLKALCDLDIEDIYFLGEMIGIRRAEVGIGNIIQIAINLKNRAQIKGKLELLVKELLNFYAHIGSKHGIS